MGTANTLLLQMKSKQYKIPEPSEVKQIRMINKPQVAVDFQ